MKSRSIKQPMDNCGDGDNNSIYVNIFGDFYVLELFYPNMSHTLSFSGMYQNHLFLVGIGQLLNKELEFIYRYYFSDRACV